MIHPSTHHTMTSTIAQAHEETRMVRTKPADPVAGAIPSPTDEQAAVMIAMEDTLLALRKRKISFSALQGVVSLFIRGGGDISLSTLAASVGVTTAAVTSVADSLEQLGFARRHVNPRDRRLMHISLTPRGRAFGEWICSNFKSGTGALAQR